MEDCLLAYEDGWHIGMYSFLGNVVALIRVICVEAVILGGVPIHSEMSSVSDTVTMCTVSPESSFLQFCNLIGCVIYVVVVHVPDPFYNCHSKSHLVSQR